MFDFFSWSHIIILLTAALIIVGPKDLPRLMHMAGKWAGKARGMANEFRRSFDEMARQSELDELRKEIEALKRPVAEAEAEMNRSMAEMPGGIAAAPPVQHEAQPEAQFEAKPETEPRSGEFQVTDAPAPPDAAPPPAPSANGTP